jgi:uncharacterized protein YcfJ
MAGHVGVRERDVVVDERDVAQDGRTLGVRVVLAIDGGLFADRIGQLGPAARERRGETWCETPS